MQKGRQYPQIGEIWTQPDAFPTQRPPRRCKALIEFIYNGVFFFDRSSIGDVFVDHTNGHVKYEASLTNSAGEDFTIEWGSFLWPHASGVKQYFILTHIASGDVMWEESGAPVLTPVWFPLPFWTSLTNEVHRDPLYNAGFNFSPDPVRYF